MAQKIFNEESVLGAVGGKTSVVPMKRGLFAIDITAGFVGTIKILKKLPKYSKFATEDGGGSAATLTDSTLDVVVNQLLNLWVSNDTDDSFGKIIANTDTTVIVAALIGGTDDDWDDGDEASIWVEVASYDAVQVLEGDSFADDEEYIALMSAWTSGAANVEFNQ